MELQMLLVKSQNSDQIHITLILYLFLAIGVLSNINPCDIRLLLGYIQIAKHLV